MKITKKMFVSLPFVVMENESHKKSLFSGSSSLLVCCSLRNVFGFGGVDVYIVHQHTLLAAHGDQH